MLTRTVLARREPTGVVVSAAMLSVLFAYLGVSPLTAVTAALIWVAVSLSGGRIIEALIGEVEARQRWLLAMGPGALLSMCLVVLGFLLVRGGWLGNVLVVAAFIVGLVGTSRRTSAESRANVGVHQSSITIVIAALIGSALLANSKEFPNLLVPSLGVLVTVIVWQVTRKLAWRYSALVLLSLALVIDFATRPDYWWWSSDDTTTLSGVGTMVIERGRVAEVAGWSTGSHHWLLQAWLALLNQLSFGHIFETYLIVWPVVAAMSMVASLWLCLEVFTGREIHATWLVVLSAIAAGMVRLEWPAPHEQQPFLFAMVACSALWVKRPPTSLSGYSLRRAAGIVLAFLMLPLILFVLKPTLLVAYGLLIVGAVVVRAEMTKGIRLFGAWAVSIGAVAAGIGLLAVSGAWVSERSFTSFSVEWFTEDLGWCRVASKPESLACVLSIQTPLIIGALLALTVVWVHRKKNLLRVSPLIFLPLVLAYLPLRYFISSGVGSGAPSFYRLSEMAVMLFIVIALAAMLHDRPWRASHWVALFFLALVISRIGSTPGALYDTVSSLLVRFSPLRFLSAVAVTSIGLAIGAAFVLARMPLFRNVTKPFITTCFCLVSLLPISDLMLASGTTQNDPIRESRPADFGPADIEEVGEWLRDNTPTETLLATNYLCPATRLSECSSPADQVECPRHTPVLMASWALTALSEREFVYLSQGWDRRKLYYFVHQTSIRLGAELSPSAVNELENLGVSYYVASRQHSNPRVWSQLLQSAAFTTDNFAVVPLATLAGNVSS